MKKRPRTKVHERSCCRSLGWPSLVLSSNLFSIAAKRGSEGIAAPLDLSLLFTIFGTFPFAAEGIRA